MFKPLLFSLLGISTAFGQGLSSFQQDNFSGVHSIYLNPGSIADSYWKAHLNIGLGSFQGTSNRLQNETLLFSGKSVKFQGTKYAATQNELRGPGLMVQLRNNHAFAITTRYRASQSFSGNYNIVNWLRGDQSVVPTGAGSLVLNNNAFSEYAFSYAAPVYEKGKHLLKAGATFKLIRGWQTSSINTNGDISANSNDDLIYKPSDFTASHSDLNFTSDLTISKMFTGKAPGSGSGVDIGLIYEYRPDAESSQYLLNGKTRSDPTSTRYLVKAGISVMDIGKIKYGQINNYNGAASGTLIQKTYKAAGSSEELRSQLVTDLGLENSAKTGTLEVKLPQTIVISADVSLGKKWYAGGVFVAPKNASTTNLNTSSQIAVGPRYEVDDFGFGVTGQYYSTYKKATVGANLRLGVFTLGTDNLLGFFKKNGLNPQAYAGFFIPLGKWRKEKDRDEDNVSDRKDQCPDLRGVWLFKGCPDTDGDGVEDRLDKCPEEAGPASTNGCPDADGDGIFDKNDACPNEAGSAKFNGCPDTDQDGVANNEDECPTLAGLPELNGCPDTDHDGIKDNHDKCPEAAGLKELEGCPLLNLNTAKSDGAEKELIASLSQALESGPVLSESLRASLQAWLTTHPNRKLSLVFSGGDQELILRIAGFYKDELQTAIGENVTASVRLTAGQNPGISVDLVP